MGCWKTARIELVDELISRGEDFRLEGAEVERGMVFATFGKMLLVLTRR